MNFKIDRVQKSVSCSPNLKTQKYIKSKKAKNKDRNDRRRSFRRRRQCLGQSSILEARTMTMQRLRESWTVQG